MIPVRAGGRLAPVGWPGSWGLHMNDHRHEHDAHGHHRASVSRTGKFVVIIAFNALITIAEYIGGILSGSLALVSDAGHNLSDVLALMLGYAGERASGARPTPVYSFGLKRFEVVIALVNAASLVVIGAYITYEAVVRYLDPRPVDPAVMIPIALVGLAGNVLSILVINRDRHVSLNMRAAFLHLAYDALSSLTVIAVGIVLVFSPGLVVLDIAASILIVVMIVMSSAGIFKDSLRIFLQGAPGHIDPEAVAREIHAVGGVGSVHGLHIWSVSSSEVFLSCHICVTVGSDPVDTDGIIGSVNTMLADRFGITHTTLQVENNPLCRLDGSDCCR